jgi:hypothetical protein
LARDTTTGKVKDNGSLHRGEKGITRVRSGIIQKVVLVDATILALGSGFAKYPLNHVHLCRYRERSFPLVTKMTHL